MTQVGLQTNTLANFNLHCAQLVRAERRSGKASALRMLDLSGYLSQAQVSYTIAPEGSLAYKAV